MKPSICHYSYHKTFQEKHWSCLDLARRVQSHGVGAIDFHVRFLGDADTAADRVKSALKETGDAH